MNKFALVFIECVRGVTEFSAFTSDARTEIKLTAATYYYYFIISLYGDSTV